MAVVVALLGCADSTSPKFGSLTVSRSSDVLFVGDTDQLAGAVSIVGGSGSGRLDWTSTNPSAASVSSEGVVTGLAPGNTNIVVQLHGSADTAAKATIGLSVSNSPFAMLPDSLRAVVGTVMLIRSGPAPSGVSVWQLHPQWTVSDASVVAVSGAKRIGAAGYSDSTTTYATAEKAGVATVSLRYNHHTASMKIVVETWPLSGVSSGGSSPGSVVGSAFSCALLPTAEAACWGTNAFLELGTPTWQECQGSGCQYTEIWQGSAAPLFVGGGLRFVTLATGGGFACGITQGGPTYCWGINSAQQLGVSSAGASCEEQAGAFPPGVLVNCSNGPLPIPGSIAFASLSAGGQHVCGLTSTGAAYCWGSNARGQLGSASAGASTSTPTPVDGGLSFRFISAGLKHTCAIAVNGDAYCWGDNSAGQLGISADTTAHFAPVRIANGVALSTIYAGNTTFGLTSSGGLYRWGPTLEQPAPSTQFAAVSVGLTDAGCALDAGGNLSCWGPPNNGATTVTAAAIGTIFRALAATGGTCGQATDNHWYCWSAATRSIGVGTPTIVPGQP